MSNLEAHFEIGEIIELNGNRYQVIGTDLASSPHPAGGKYFNWDYLLKRTDNNDYKRVTREDLKNAQLVENKG